MYIRAKVDYGLQALLVLTASGKPETCEELAAAQHLPAGYLISILRVLCYAGLMISQPLPLGGYRLARSPDAITVAEVIRALDGPLADVRGLRPEDTSDKGAAAHLRDVWAAVRASVRSVLTIVTLEAVVSGYFPRSVAQLIEDPDAWIARSWT